MLKEESSSGRGEELVCDLCRTGGIRLCVVLSTARDLLMGERDTLRRARVAGHDTKMVCVKHERTVQVCTWGKRDSFWIGTGWSEGSRG